MSALETGKTFGGYTLLRRIARGGMGEIWLAERKGISGFSKRVVIKTILENFIEEESLIQMFLDEGRIAADLNHPNVAQTFDLGQEGEIYYIAMEFVHGHDLRELLLAHYDRGQLVPLNLVLRIAAQVCDGLYYANTWKTPEGIPGGIVHRDISPQNILVTFDGNAKIVDFGIARAMSGASKTRSGILKGKCAYMSPEQIHGQELDGRSDIFALGVVLFEMITGRRLFKRDSELATLDAVIKGQVPPPSQLDATVPKQVGKLVMTALQRKRSKRFADARQMQLATEEVMQATGLTATSAHLSTYMHKIFSEDLELNRTRLKEIKKRMKAVPGVKEEAPALERTQPYMGGQELGPTLGTNSPTRNLIGGRSLATGQSSRAVWIIIALVMVVLGSGAMLIWLYFNDPESAKPDLLDGGLVTAGAGDIGPADKLLKDAGVIAADPQTQPGGPGSADGASAVDEAPIAVEKPTDKPNGKKKRKQKRKRKVRPDPGADKPLDILMER